MHQTLAPEVESLLRLSSACLLVKVKLSPNRQFSSSKITSITNLQKLACGSTLPILVSRFLPNPLGGKSFLLGRKSYRVSGVGSSFISAVYSMVGKLQQGRADEVARNGAL
jgi:hypothetical protein